VAAAPFSFCMRMLGGLVFELVAHVSIARSGGG
jgi:hypothetical protein